jgi:hypothetical protein
MGALFFLSLITILSTYHVAASSLAYICMNAYTYVSEHEESALFFFLIIAIKSSVVPGFENDRAAESYSLCIGSRGHCGNLPINRQYYL